MKTNNIPIEYAKNNNKSHFQTITSYNYKKNNEGQKKKIIIKLIII